MKKESMVPESLLSAFNHFSSLETQLEKDEFWEELAKNNEGISPEIFNQQLKQGLEALSHQVKALERAVKNKIPA